MSDRPYRVGMARPVQRHIEPAEIYSDLKRGPATTMPDNFGYTWTPVNGLDGLGEPDIIDAVQLPVGASAGKETLIVPGAEKKLLDSVQDSARQGVVKEVKKNAPNLMLLAVAGGAIGGVLSNKLGKTGTAIAVGLAVWSGWQLMNPDEKK